MIAGGLRRWLAAAPLALLVACAAPETRFDPPAGDVPPLARAVDAHVEARLEAFLAPNAPGSWMQDAHWDEYLLTVRAVGEVAATVTDVALFDVLGHRLPTRSDRSGLSETTNETARRYERSKDLVRSESGYWMLAGGAFGVAASTAVAAATSFGALMGGAAAASTPLAAGFFAVGGVVMVMAGVTVAATNAVTQATLNSRQTPLPAEATRQAPARLDLFFPVTPLPQSIEIRYTAGGKRHRLHVDTRAALSEAHRR